MNSLFFAAEGIFLISAFDSLITVSLIGVVLIVFAWVLDHLVRRWISPHVLYVLWLIVLARFVLPGVPESPASFLNLSSLPNAKVNEIDQRPSAVETSISSLADRTINFSKVMDSPKSKLETQASLSDRNRLWATFALIWLFGIGFMLARFFRARTEITRIIADSKAAPELIEAAFEKAKAELKCRQNSVLRITESLESPAITGVLRPVVLVPQWCIRELPQQQLELILFHELMHIRRWDSLIQLLTHSVAILHWFNPFLHYVSLRILALRELACDQQVLAFLEKNKQMGSSLLYGETILTVASKSTTNAPFCSAFMGGFIGDEENLIKQRIVMLIKPKFGRLANRVANIFAVIGILTLLAVGFTSAKSVAQEKSDQPAVRPKESDKRQTLESNDETVDVAVNLRIYEVSKSSLKDQKIGWLDSTGAEQQLESVIDIVSGERSKKTSHPATEVVSADHMKRVEKLIQSLVEMKVASLFSDVNLVARDSRTEEYVAGKKIPMTVKNENDLNAARFRMVRKTLNITPKIRSNGELQLEITAEVSDDAGLLENNGRGIFLGRMNCGAVLETGQTLLIAGFDNQFKESPTEVIFVLTPRTINANQGH